MVGTLYVKAQEGEFVSTVFGQDRIRSMMVYLLAPRDVDRA